MIGYITSTPDILGHAHNEEKTEPMGNEWYQKFELCNVCCSKLSKKEYNKKTEGTM